MDVNCIRIKLFLLKPGVKYPEIRLCITACRGGPLPVTIIDRWIIINQMLCEITLSLALINMQIFGEKCSGYHADAIMHETGFVEFMHTGIDKGIAR